MLLVEERAYVVLLFGGALYAFESEVKVVELSGSVSV
jgi:hypothetical protein